MSPCELNSCELWSHGPTFLNLPETRWPLLKPGDTFIEREEFTKVEKVSKDNMCLFSVVHHTEINPDDASCLLRSVDSIDDPSISEIIDIHRFNSLIKLVRVTAWVIKFIHNLKKKIEERRNTDVNNVEINNVTTDSEAVPEDTLNSKELTEAKNLWIQSSQRLIKTHKNLKQWSVNLNTFTDENSLLRCRGRLENAPIPYEAKYPLLLTTESYFTRLVVLHAHNEVAHNGTRETLNRVRQEYWIPRGRNFVRKVVKSCWLCNYFEGKTFPYPNPPDLPESRLTDDRAFSNVGLDYAGPVYVKNVYGDLTDIFKCWIALITCASIRGVYLDLVADSSSTECIEMIKRLIARFGAPSLIISDNGKSFISNETQDFAACRNITWKFNLEASPWQGGFFERMVKSTKRCLKKLLLHTTVTYNELLTLLKEIESVLNNGEITDLPLTPNHMIYGRLLNPVANKNNAEGNEELTNVNEKFSSISNLLKHFWERWRCEYVNELREHHRRRHTNDEASISINDVVLIVDKKQPRLNWRVGRVIELITSNDNPTRCAKLLTHSGQGRISSLRRPINKLVPLELDLNKRVMKEDDMIQLTFVDDEEVSNIVRC